MDALIPRSVLFSNPTRTMVRISGDGAWLAWLAPLDGVLNVWVAPVADLAAARPVTQDEGRGIRSYAWAHDHTTLLFVQDRDGDENWRLFAVSVDGGEPVDLTAGAEEVSAQILKLSRRKPTQLLMSLNDRDARFHDVFLVDLETGARELVLENPGFMGFVADDDFKVRLAVQPTADGGFIIHQREGDGWKPWQEVGKDDALTTSPLGFKGDQLFMQDSRGRDTAALYLLDPSGQARLIAADDKADLTRWLLHPQTDEVQAVAFTYDRDRWQYMDAGVEADLKHLQQHAHGELEVVSRTDDDNVWIVADMRDDGPVTYLTFDRSSRAIGTLFSNRPELEGQPLARMHARILPARDGLDLVSYLTVPRYADPEATGVPTAPVPMVLLVHGGPWARDDWGYNSYHQWLANRGYAVLSVNFRGSTGFGKSFINAGDLEWSGKMHDDLLDAVQWAVDSGVALADKVAIMGGSYGGYATLVGLTYTPEQFACGVDIVGPSNLETLLETIPPYWASFFETLAKRVGDPRTEDGLAHLKACSPLHKADQIVRPLLIGQGANDPRVKQAESDQIVSAMESKGLPVTYVLYPDEGHGFAKPENNRSFNAVTEAFLSAHLGGRLEPMNAADVDGASIQVPHGPDFVPGLAAVLG